MPSIPKSILRRRFAFGAIIALPIVTAVLYPYYTSSQADPMTSKITMSAIRAANLETKRFVSERIKSNVANREKQVAVFVGGTSGTGLLAMQKWIDIVGEDGGKLYFVGRNKAAADKITTDLTKSYPKVTIEFIHTPDIALLSNAEKLANEILSKESHLNLLVLSQGLATISNTRDETTEGIERKMATNVYSRFLITRRLLPLLVKAQEISKDDTSAPFYAPRVISIFSPGTEGTINESDLELKKQENFSNPKCAAQATAMNTLLMEKLSTLHPDLGFLHVYPSFVVTGLARDLSAPLRVAYSAMGPLLAVKHSDSSEGLGWLATRNAKGLQLVDWKGESKDTRQGQGPWYSKLFGADPTWWRDGLAEVIWKHQGEVEERILGK